MQSNGKYEVPDEDSLTVEESDGRGWFKTWRKITDSAVGQDMELLGCWIYLLSEANWAERQLLSGDILKAGDLCVGMLALGRAWNCGKSTAHRRLKTFERLGMIRTKRGKLGTIVSICQWRRYQNDIADGGKNLGQVRDDRGTIVGRSWDDRGTIVGQVREQKKKGRREEGKKESIEEGKKGRTSNYVAKTRDGVVSSDIDLIVQHYRTHHPRSNPGAKDRKKIADRIREGWTVDQMRIAIDGCHVSPFHCGENDRGAKYQTIGLIFRDSDHVQQFIEALEAKDQPVLTERGSRNIRAAKSALAKWGSHEADDT